MYFCHQPLLSHYCYDWLLMYAGHENIFFVGLHKWQWPLWVCGNDRCWSSKTAEQWIEVWSWQGFHSWPRGSHGNRIPLPNLYCDTISNFWVFVKTQHLTKDKKLPAASYDFANQTFYVLCIIVSSSIKCLYLKWKITLELLYEHLTAK